MADNNTQQTRRKSTQPIDTTIGHVPPQALEIERMVLGALMIDHDAFSVISEILHPQTFYERKNQLVYQAIQTLNLNEHPVDHNTVLEELKKEGTVEESGGLPYLLELTDRVMSSAHIEYHARILAQKYMARQLISYASMIETNAFDESVDVDVLMQKAEGSLFELSQRNMRQDYVQINSVVEQAVAAIQQAASNKGGLTGVPTGYTKLDQITSGLQKSDLVIIAGRPAMGKTSFALSMAKNIAVDYRRPVAFFSLEMNNLQLVNRILSNVCEVPGSKIMNGQLDDAEWKRFDKNLRKLENVPLYIDDTAGLSIFELRTKARRLVREKKVEVIMIDYLQLMNANGAKFGNRQEEVSTISRSLKQLAKELDIPILALSQLNRTVDNREGPDGKRPQLSDLRESGAIEQDADIVLFVHRPEYYHIDTDPKGNDLHGMAQIIIAKHRKGAIDDVLLHFKGEFTRFANPEDAAPYSSGGEIVGSRMNSGPQPDDSMGPQSNFDPFAGGDSGELPY